ncbi:MAG: type II toxin-antitoxin system PemK/MazF family toxin [Candidatus Yonathbacteria bacterium]|nr:type II toxin-antitoxin system PemK/MazF family toxin [Candidatus Yonathbacteria bacterium]
MKKDFQKWHKKKEFLQDEKARPFFHEREVWFCSLGENVGFEQDGRGEEFLRPVVVIKKFNQEVCCGVPLTRNQKNGQYYFSFSLDEETSTAILLQIRLIDSKRLQYKLGDLSEADFIEMRKRLTQLLA